MDYLQQGMNLVKTGVIGFGGFWTVWGIIVFATGLKEHNGQDIKNGMLQAIGGAVVVAAGAWLSTLNFSFA